MNCISNKSVIIDVIEKISIEAKNSDKQFGIITTDKELIDASLMKGVNMLSYGSELNMLIQQIYQIHPIRQDYLILMVVELHLFILQIKQQDFHFSSGSPKKT